MNAVRNFLQMSFDDNNFDGAYSIEATCHAPKLDEVYDEIYRVLKPRSLYVSYKRVTTNLYQADDPEHVEVIKGIERGDMFPGLRSYIDISEMARKVGFEGAVDVHGMLFVTADYLTCGGETGIFTPMHMIVCRKPERQSKSD